MRVHLVQLDIRWEDAEANLARVDRLLTAADVMPGDLIVLPELFHCGFSLRVDAIADGRGAVLRWAAALAADLRCTVQAGRAVKDCDCAKATNHMTVLGPPFTGDEATLLADYAKIHPFSYGREGEAYQGGHAVVTYEWAGADDRLRVCPAVCYDLRFPELFRAGLAQGAEAYALGANWPDARMGHWRALAIARAIENQAFVLAVNRTGPDPHLNYVGGSLVVDPTGAVLGEAGADETVLTVDLDPAAARRWRAEFPAVADRRFDTVLRG